MVLQRGTWDPQKCVPRSSVTDQTAVFARLFIILGVKHDEGPEEEKEWKEGKEWKQGKERKEWKEWKEWKNLYRLYIESL